MDTQNIVPDDPEPIKPRLLTKSAVLVASFMAAAPITLVLSLYVLFSLSGPNLQSPVLAAESLGHQDSADLPAKQATPATIDGQAQPTDARVLIVQNYLLTYKSPLFPYAAHIVKTADRYDLDFRLITAIAQQESNLCKKIPEGSFNCWGWGIHSKGTLGFESFEEGIDTVSRGLRDKYIAKGYETPDEIMTKYTPQSNGSWAEGVNAFMFKMR